MKTFLRDPRNDSAENTSELRHDSNDRRMAIHTHYNLSCISREELKNRSNSPLQGIRDLLEAEEELNQIFNKNKRDIWGWLPQPSHHDMSPDSRKTA